MIRKFLKIIWVCGAMDNASDYESGDCRFDSCQTRIFWPSFVFELRLKSNPIITNKIINI